MDLQLQALHVSLSLHQAISSVKNAFLGSQAYYELWRLAQAMNAIINLIISPRSEKPYGTLREKRRGW